MTAIVFDGNSLTVGYPVTEPNSYPSQVIGLLGTGYSKTNLAVSSQTIAQMAADAATEVDSLFTSPNVTMLTAWEFTNSLFNGVSASTALTQWQSYCSARKAAGWTVIHLSVLPFGSAEAARGTVNTSLRAAFSTSTAYSRVYTASSGTTWADVFVDVAANTLLSDNTNTTYYNADGVHLTLAGYTQIAGDVRNGILVAQSLPPPTLPPFPGAPVNLIATPNSSSEIILSWEAGSPLLQSGGGRDLQAVLNSLAGTTGLDLVGAANALAGTSKLELVGALNVAAGTSKLDFNAAAKAVAVLHGGSSLFDANGAFASIGVSSAPSPPTLSAHGVSSTEIQLTWT